MLSGRKVLIVEDEPIVAMLLDDMLSDLGMSTAGFARTLDNALAAADRKTFDVAVMDINLRGQVSYPVAEKLAQAGIPLVFVTGYSRARPPGALEDAPLLHKPYEIHELAGALHRALDGAVAA